MADGFLETGIISPARMRAVDANAMALGVTELQLMESAGRALADIALAARPGPCPHPLREREQWRRRDGCGPPSPARASETDVCYLDSGERSQACEHQLAALKHCRVPLHPFQCRDDLEAVGSLFEKADVIVDALLGTGASGTLTEPLATCVAMANASKAKIIAADVPTPGMRADRICAFHRAKMEGSTVVDIGIPVEAECFVGPGILPFSRPGTRKPTRVSGERS